MKGLLLLNWSEKFLKPLSIIERRQNEEKSIPTKIMDNKIDERFDEENHDFYHIEPDDQL